MKKYISLFVLIISGFVMQGQGIRNSLLGIYTGQYWDYNSWPNHVDAGVKITAHPTDTSGMIINDTLNNVIDTIQIRILTVFPEMNNDTVVFVKMHYAGDVKPYCDSVTYVRYETPDSPNGFGMFRLKCDNYTFPTSINNNYKLKFNLYPNPTTDRLYISAEKDLFKTYSIYTVYGQVVDSGIYNSTIETESLPIGMYYLKLSGKTEAVKSFIKN